MYSKLYTTNNSSSNGRTRAVDMDDILYMPRVLPLLLLSPLLLRLSLYCEQNGRRVVCVCARVCMCPWVWGDKKKKKKNENGIRCFLFARTVFSCTRPGTAADPPPKNRVAFYPTRWWPGRRTRRSTSPGMINRVRARCRRGGVCVCAWEGVGGRPCNYFRLVKPSRG